MLVRHRAGTPVVADLIGSGPGRGFETTKGES